MNELHLLHDEQVELFGGDGGVRDANGIEATLARPIHHYLYNEDVDLADLASIYLVGIAGDQQNFVDGNKRTGVAAALTFLKVNKCPLHVPRLELLQIAHFAATHQVGWPVVAEWMRRRISDPHRRIESDGKIITEVDSVERDIARWIESVDEEWRL